MCLAQRDEIDARQYVAAANVDGAADFMDGVFDCAGGSQRLFFKDVVQFDAKTAAVAEICLDRLGQIAARQDHFVDACCAQPLDDPADEGPAEKRRHRLGHRISQRPKASAFTADEYNCLHNSSPTLRAITSSLLAPVVSRSCARAA